MGSAGMAIAEVGGAGSGGGRDGWGNSATADGWDNNGQLPGQLPEPLAWMCRYGGQQNAARSTQVNEIQEPTLALLLHSAFSSLSHNGYGCCCCWLPVVVC